MNRVRASILAVLVVAAGLLPAGAAVVTRGPYLQLGTPTSIVVRWRTDMATDSRVVYGPAPGSLGSAVSDPVLLSEHEIVLDGLDPQTTYYYGVGTATELLAGDDADHFFVTPPLAGTPLAQRIWVLGDSGTGNASAMAVRDAYLAFSATTATDLWLMLGDNAYPSGTDGEYQTTLFDIYPTMLRRAVLWPTLGNHDAASADSATQSGPYYDVFTLPTGGEAGGLASGTEAYYAFDWANAHFVVLDSQDTDRSPGGAMLTWLEADLAATTQDWIIAYWHHPPYSKGSHDSDTELQMVEMRENAVPILEDYGVDLVLAGHSHDYERSFLIDGHYGDSTTLVPDMVLDGGDGSPFGDGPYLKPALGPDPHQGAVYAVAGSSGQISGGSLDHPAMVVSLNVHGSLVLDLDGATLDATFLDKDGLVRDTFRIVKGSGCPDPDGDGVCSGSDNCPAVANPAQEDADADGRGDVCDVCPFDPLDDADADGYCADADNCPDDPNPDQADADMDGVGDVCDACPSDPLNDVDADGVCGGMDNCPTLPNPGQADADADGFGDVCDPCPLDPLNDADGDGHCADVDNCPNVPNPGQTDTDGDGIGDACDACPIDPTDFDGDGDGVPDLCDCAPLSPGVAHAPQPVAGTLVMGRSGNTGLLRWQRGIEGHVSNVYRTSMLGGSTIGSTCVVGETPLTQRGDATMPGPGVILVYLVSAENGCAESAAGEQSDGTPIPPPTTCPSPGADSDHDGVADKWDHCPLAADPTLADADQDFVGDVCDNCPLVPNPDQADADGNGVGDACE